MTEKNVTTDLGCDEKLTKEKKDGIILLAAPSDHHICGIKSFNGAASKFTPYTWRGLDFTQSQSNF